MAKERLQKAGALVLVNIVTWQWTKQLLYWIIISAGTMSELVFLGASLWMSINSSVHPFVRFFLSEQATINITYLATTMYVALPECILGLSIVTVFRHAKKWAYTRATKTRDRSAPLWTILFALPTAVFLGLSLITVGCSVASTEFILPVPLVVCRALAGFIFALLSLLHFYIGKPAEAERLKAKDAEIEDLKFKRDADVAKLEAEKDDEIARLAKDNRTLSDELTRVKDLLAISKNKETALLTAIHKTSEDALQAYSDECKQWVKSGIKTASLDEITRYTGHSKRKVNNAIDAGKLQVSPRNKMLVLVSSLVEWMTQNPPRSEEDKPDLYVVNG